MTSQQLQSSNGNIAAPDSFVSARIFIRALRFVPENQLSLLLGREFDRIHPQVTVSAYFDGENYSTTPYPLFHLPNDQSRIYQFCDIEEEFYILFDVSELLQHPNPNKHRKGVTFIVKLNPGGIELGKLLIKLNAIQPYDLDQGYQEFQLGHSSMRLGMEIRIMEVSDIPSSRVDYGRYKPQKQRMFVMSREQDQEDQYYLQAHQSLRDAASSRQTSHNGDGVVPSLVRPGSSQQQLLEQRQQREAQLNYFRKASPRSPQSPRSDLIYLDKNQQPQEIIVQQPPVDYPPSDVAIILENSENQNQQTGIQDNRSFLQKVNPAFLKPFGRSKKQRKFKGDTSNLSESVDQQSQDDTYSAQSTAQFIAFDNNNNINYSQSPPRNSSPSSSQQYSQRNNYPSPLQPVPIHAQPPNQPQNFNNDQHANNAQHHHYVNKDDRHVQKTNSGLRGRSASRGGSFNEKRQQQNEVQEQQVQINGKKGKKSRQRNKQQNPSENNSDNNYNLESSEYDTLGSQNQSRESDNSPRRNQRSASSKNSETKQKTLVSNDLDQKSSKMVNAEVQTKPKMVDQEVLVETLKPKKTRDFWAQVQIGTSRSNSARSSGRSLSPRSLSRSDTGNKSVKNSVSMVDTGVQPFPDFQIGIQKNTSENQNQRSDKKQFVEQGTQVENLPAVVVQEVEKIVPLVLYVKEPQESLHDVQQFGKKQEQINQQQGLQTENLTQIDFQQQQPVNFQNFSLQIQKNADYQSDLEIQDNFEEEFSAQESPKFIGEDFQGQDEYMHDMHNMHDMQVSDNNKNNQDSQYQYQQQQQFDDTINVMEIQVDSFTTDSPRFIPPSREASVNVEGKLTNQDEAITFDLSSIVEANLKNSKIKNKKYQPDFQFQVDAKSQEEEEEELHSPTQSSSTGIRSIFNIWRRNSRPNEKMSATEPIPESIQFSHGENDKNYQDAISQDDDDDEVNQQSNLVQVNSISQDVQYAINNVTIIGTDVPISDSNGVIIAPRTSIDTKNGIQIQDSLDSQQKAQIDTQLTKKVVNQDTRDVQDVRNVDKSEGIIIAPVASMDTVDASEGTVDAQQMAQISTQDVGFGTQHAENGTQYVESSTQRIEGGLVKRRSSDGFESILDDDSERFQCIGEERKTSKKFRLIPVKKVSVGTDPMESLLNQVKLNRWRVRRARERGEIPPPPAIPTERLWSERAQQYRARQQLDYESQLTIENVRHFREKYGDEDEDEELWEQGKQQKQGGSYKGSGTRSAMNDDPMYLKTATRGRLIQPSDKLRCLSPQPSRQSFKQLSCKGTGTMEDGTSNYSEEGVSAKMGGPRMVDNTDNLSDMSAPVSLNHVEMSNEPREFPKHIPEWASFRLRRTFDRGSSVDIERIEQEIVEEEGGDLLLPETVSINNRMLGSGIHHSTPAHRITPQLLGQAIERRFEKHTRHGSQASLLSTRSTVSLRRFQKETKKEEEEDKTQLDGSLGWKVQALIGVFDQSQN